MIPLKVLGDRVLVKPDQDANAPEQLESGIVVAKSLAAAVTGADPTQSFSRGTVIAVGNPTHPLKHEAEDLAMRLNARVSNRLADEPIFDAAAMLRDLVRRLPAAAVGDDVLYSHDAGQAITLDHDTYIILHEHELLAIVDPDEVPA